MAQMLGPRTLRTGTRRAAACLLTAALLTGCGSSQPAPTPAATPGAPATSAASTAGPTAGPGVVIRAPADGAVLPSLAITVEYAATGGPFIEVDLLVDNTIAATAPGDGVSPDVRGVLVWQQPSGGVHTLTVNTLDMNKQVRTASVLISVVGGPTTMPSPAPTPDAAKAAAEARILKVLHDTYGLTLTSPPISRKAREGGTADPWVAAVFTQHWFIDVSVYPDGRVMDYADPLAYTPATYKPSLIQSDDKPISMCRPAGTLKVLAVFTDYHNMGATREVAFGALAEATRRINVAYLAASQLAGLTEPILQLAVTPAYLASPTKSAGGLMLAAEIQKATGIDPSGFDIVSQIDLDGADTAGIIKRYGSHGWDSGGCWPVKGEVNMWIGIATLAQLSASSPDPRLLNVMGHELLHAFGYPIGLTGLHEWVCGDGIVPDATDQCDQNNLPVLMLGWTDTDGDGIVEILDPTPYGMTSPNP